LLFSTIMAFCCAFSSPDISRTAPEEPAPVAIHSGASDSNPSAQPSLPDAPAAKVLSSSSAHDATPVSSENITPATPPFSNAAVKPAIRGTYETARQRKIWYGLVAAGSGAAAFDAWTTRRAVSGGYGVEGDPVMRPFAHSNAMYAATQISPVVMDYLGHRMMTSRHPWMRRYWWVPQVAGTSFSLSAGVHNYHLVP
jgi:hypothetical protein